MSVETDYKELEELAQRERWLVISTVAGSGAGHVGGPFSAMDLHSKVATKEELMVIAAELGIEKA